MTHGVLNYVAYFKTTQSKCYQTSHMQRGVEDWLSVTRSGISLGLLRSRSDPIGEWSVHKPAFRGQHIMCVPPNCKWELRDHLID